MSRFVLDARCGVDLCPDCGDCLAIVDNTGATICKTTGRRHPTTVVLDHDEAISWFGSEIELRANALEVAI